ncbi:MAG: dihydrolipoyl dehydrogenase [Spirochaetes bacterium]|nr:dihydrolipoyl dehydrogenase [Spirochaetota bacterium]
MSKSNTKTFDVIVIGAGPGGYVAAIRAAQLGMKTAIIEKRNTLGGTCLNIGCIPSKALLDSSEFFARAKHEGSEHGVVSRELSLDLAAMQKRKDGVVEKLVSGVSTLMKKNKITVFNGTGRLEQAGGGSSGGGSNGNAGGAGTPPHPVVVTAENGEETRIEGAHVVIASGSVPQELPFLPFDGERIVSSTEALAFDTVPKKLLVVGAGAIGLELGSVWARLGAEVDVIEILPEILSGWDSATAKALRRELSKQGLTFNLETKVTGVDMSKKKQVTLEAESKDGAAVKFEGDKVLVAVGRRPYAENLGLETAGIEMEENGRRINIDEHFETSVPGVYAIGDVVRGAMLAHKAEDEGVAVAEIIAGKPGHVNYDAVPNVVYTWPEVAAVGRSEDELKEEEHSYRKGQFPFAANGRALGMGAPAGFVKIMADSKTDRVLGATIVGPYASDLISEIVTVIEFGGSSEDIARTVHAHPTLPEAVREAALAVDKRSIHGA